MPRKSKQELVNCLLQALREMAGPTEDELVNGHRVALVASSSSLMTALYRKTGISAGTIPEHLKTLVNAGFFEPGQRGKMTTRWVRVEGEYRETP